MQYVWYTVNINNIFSTFYAQFIYFCIYLLCCIQSYLHAIKAYILLIHTFLYLFCLLAFLSKVIALLSRHTFYPVPPLPICRVRSLHWAPTPWGGTIPVAPKQLKIKRDTPLTHPWPLCSCLRLNANDHNWWTTMPMKRHLQSAAKKIYKKDGNKCFL